MTLEIKYALYVAVVLITEWLNGYVTAALTVIFTYIQLGALLLSGKKQRQGSKTACGITER